MFGRPANPRKIPIHYDLNKARFAERPQAAGENLSTDEIEAIKMRLGGEAILARIGVDSFIAGPGNVTFRLGAHNPNKVKTVVISKEPGGFFKMTCYG
jgi:hypothetical protein